MNPLFNANGEQVPPRPELTDEIIKAGTLKAVQSGNLSRINADEAEELAIDMVRHYSHGIDAYDLAKAMDTFGCWDVDSMFVDDMEQVDWHIQDLYREAIKNWAETFQPVPPFEIGAELRVYSLSTDRHGGVIDGICQHSPATYLVKMNDRPEDDTSRRLVKFEDATLPKLDVGDVVKPIKPEYQLASGFGRYDSAVVVSVEPFVLVSHGADMLWQFSIKREHFKVSGKVEVDDLDRCLARLEK
ncbi:hypothetical protein RFA54_001639 [Vibrio vulnificus]|nr:hypothetical protein [Vibrio vulnificus]